MILIFRLLDFHHCCVTVSQLFGLIQPDLFTALPIIPKKPLRSSSSPQVLTYDRANTGVARL